MALYSAAGISARIDFAASSPRRSGRLDDWIYFLTIYGRASGETLRFKAYIAKCDTVVDVEEQFLCEAGGVCGDPVNPLVKCEFARAAVRAVDYGRCRGSVLRCPSKVKYNLSP